MDVLIEPIKLAAAIVALATAVVKSLPKAGGPYDRKDKEGR